MDLNFIEVNEKVLNLNAVVLIEDQSTETETIAIVNLTDGTELTFDGDDAKALFARAELIVDATDRLVSQMLLAAAQLQAQQGANQ